MVRRLVTGVVLVGGLLPLGGGVDAVAAPGTEPASSYNGRIQGSAYECIAPRDPSGPIEGWAVDGTDTGVRFNGTKWGGNVKCDPGDLRISQFPPVRISGTTMYMQRGNRGSTDQDRGAIRHGLVRVGELSRRPSRVEPSAPNGRPCRSVTETYYDNPRRMPANFEYKPNQKHSDWENYGDPLQTDGTTPIPGAHYNYVLWSWLTDSQKNRNPGGGQPRAIIGKNEPVHKCDVKAITSFAYAKNSKKVVGYVRAIYGRVDTNSGDSVYGWIVHSWRRKGSSDWHYLLSANPVS